MPFKVGNQYIKAVRDSVIKKSGSDTLKNRTDVFSLKYLPAKHQLIQWSTELAYMNRIAALYFTMWNATLATWCIMMLNT